MFLKSKQQIIREQLELKPKKSIQSLRQGLSKVANKTNNTKGEGKEKEEGKTLRFSGNVPEIAMELRNNVTNPDSVQHFLSYLKNGNANSILQFLTGKELVKILKCLDLPCFSGKSKAKQIDTVEKYLLSEEVVIIKYPEKV